jgi:hypothetical protein
MKIVELRPRTGIFAGCEPIRFCPGINVIRGANGIGKTTILEHASLLGHLSVMKRAAPVGNPSLSMLIKLSKCDIDFLGELVRGSLPEAAAPYYEFALARMGFAIADIASVDISAQEFVLDFTFPTITDDQLKTVLADEKEIEKRISVSSSQIDVRLVQALVAWSRPFCIDDKEVGPWSVTPRLICQKEKPEWGCTGASPIFYVNTDMYEFGAGLDIRESPKHLKSKITSVLQDRLQLLNYDARPQNGSSISDALVAEESQSLLCEDDLKAGWKGVFGNHHEFRIGEVRCSGTTKKSRHLSWIFKIGDRESSEFVSSGENQALFVLAMIYGLAGSGSCMLMDEPELHLTFRSGSELVERIFERAQDTESQAIIVTHLPHLHRERVSDVSDGWRDDQPFDYHAIRMIYVARDGSSLDLAYDVDAMNCAARSSHEDVRRLIDGLRLAKEVPILPDWNEIRKWLAKFIPLA